MNRQNNPPRSQHGRDDRGGGPSRSFARAIDVTFYENKAENRINPTLLDRDAEAQADALHRSINSAQIRRFFGEIKNIYLRLEQKKEWTQLEPLFRMVKSKALYALGTSRIPREFCSFLTENIDKVKDEQDFRAFVLYFEAVLGFAYGKGLVRK